MGVFSGPDTSESGLVLALDAANKKSYSQNEFLYSTDIFAWSGSAGHNAATITRDTISSPVGNTPLKMAVTGSDPHIATYNSSTWNIAPAANGQTWVVSVYVKADVATTGEILIFGADSSGTAFVGGGWLSLTSSTVNITTEWTRVQHVHTMSNASVAYIHVRLDGPNSGGTGQTVWWDGLQVERVPSGTTAPTPFTSRYLGGNVLSDLSGNSNTGTLTNYPTYSSANGGSIVFDGINDYVSVLNTSQLRPSTELSIGMWIKANSITAGWVRLFGQDPYTGGPLIFLETGGSLIRALHYPNGVEVRCTTNYSISTTQYTYVVFTFKTGDAIRSYFNGVANTTAALSAGTFSYNTSNPYLMGHCGDSWFNGNISNVSYYNRALTASEIQQNFNATRGRYGI